MQQEHLTGDPYDECASCGSWRYTHNNPDRISDCRTFRSKRAREKEMDTKKMTTDGLDPLRWAKFYASIKHAGQQYAGGLPYTHHLSNVEQVLRRFGVGGRATKDLPNSIDFELLQAAWLHDICEDCGVKRKEIAEMFGETVAGLVWAVTNEPGENRKVRAALTYPKIRGTRGGVTLKLADRIANVEQGGNLVSMYRKEYEDFKRGLFAAGGEAEGMWGHLDGLLL